MAEGSGGASGVLGVIVGALIVIMVGGAVLYSTGHLGGGGKTATLKVELPKAK